MFSCYQDDFEAAELFYKEGLRLAREIDDKRIIAVALAVNFSFSNTRVSSFFTKGKTAKQLFFADVFVPNVRMRGDIFVQHFKTFVRIQINHFDTVFLEPFDAALKSPRFADNDRADLELSNQARTIPTRRERRYHNRIAVGFLPSALTKCVCFAVNRCVVFLNSPIASFAEKISFAVK